MLAVIPARGGAKEYRIKIYVIWDGKPLIAYTIEAAIKQKYLIKLLCQPIVLKLQR